MLSVLRSYLLRRVPYLQKTTIWPMSVEIGLGGVKEGRHYCSSGNFESIMACLPYYTKGQVIKGFGRGSKDLGIPTANLPESVVNDLPSELETGIYYGLSNINGGDVYKTVLSIGWNPFYHNVKKSLEAHLIKKLDYDFYGSDLRLIILGYIRPEKNYPSMELLIEAINNDIEVAKRELDKPENIKFQKDNFFRNVEDINKGTSLPNGET